jgi:hypothetical protein
MESALRLLKLSRRTMVIAVQNKGSSNLLKLNTTDSPLIIQGQNQTCSQFLLWQVHLFKYTCSSTLVQVHLFKYTCSSTLICYSFWMQVPTCHRKNWQSINFVCTAKKIWQSNLSTCMLRLVSDLSLYWKPKTCTRRHVQLIGKTFRMKSCHRKLARLWPT